MPTPEILEAVAPWDTRQATKRGTVYIVQGEDNGKFKRAERFGDLVFLMQRDAFPDNADERIDKMRHVMEATLSMFYPSRDYVLLTGDPLAIAMCILTLSQWTLQIPCLKWDKHEQDYYPVTVSI